MPVAERNSEVDKKGDTLRIMERLDRLETVVKQHIQGKAWVSSYFTRMESLSSALHLEKVCL